MSHDLDDLKRLKITDATRKWLKSESIRTGFTVQEIARERLHRIALREIEAARLLFDSTTDEDIDRDSRGRKYDKHRP